MPESLVTDVNLSAKQISNLASPEALAAFFSQLGYDTGTRATLTPEAIGLAGDSAAAVKQIEILAKDTEDFLQVTFVQLRSLTAKSRNDLARVLGKTNVDHLLVLTSDFSVLEFVLLQKRYRESRGPGNAALVRPATATSCGEIQTAQSGFASALVIKL